MFGQLGMGPVMPGAEMQQMQQPMGSNFISQSDLVDEREVAYETAFKDNAYNVFSSKHPEMVPQIVTFKVLKSSIDDGTASGAFILENAGDVFYVPAIMVDHMLKPMEVIYSKKMDKFVPFNQEWLSAIEASSQQALGEGVKAPANLQPDTDIRNLILPPMVGRTSYAMDLSEIDHLGIVKQASNEAKEAYRSILKNNKEILKFAFENFDNDRIFDALEPHQEKVASVPVKLETMDMTTGSAKVKEAFGTQAGEAMKDMAQKGFAFKDERPELNKVFSTADTKLQLEEPAANGVYTIYDSDGSKYTALVIMNPRCIHSGDIEIPYAPKNNESYTLGDWTTKRPISHNNYLVIKGNGDYFTTSDLVASPSNPNEITGAVKDRVFGGGEAKNVNGHMVVFIKTEGNIIDATQPLRIDRTEMSSDGFKKFIKLRDWESEDEFGRKIKKPEVCVLHAPTTTGKISQPKNGDLVLVPKTYRTLVVGKKVPQTHLTSAKDVLNFVQNTMTGRGGETVKLANIGGGEFAVNNIACGSLRKTAESVAEKYYVPMGVIVNSLEKLSSIGQYDKLLVTPHEKRASIFSQGTDGTTMSPESVGAMYPPAQPPAQMMPPGPPPMMPTEMPNQQQLMNIGQQTGDTELFSMGVLNSLSSYPDVRSLLAVYSPVIEKALDSVGRMLLTFWMRGNKAKEELGEETFFNTEDSLRTVFKELGALLLKLNNRAAAEMPTSF